MCFGGEPAAFLVFTVSNLVTSDAFPPEAQPLAGSFNEVAQLGNLVGLAVCCYCSNPSQHSKPQNPRDALMEGHRGFTRTMFASTAVGCSLLGT